MQVCPRVHYSRPVASRQLPPADLFRALSAFKRFSDRAYGAGPAVGYGRWTDHRVEKAAISCFSIGIDMMAKRD
jgi:hypothetical protein